MTGTEKQIAWAEQIQQENQASFTIEVKACINGSLFKAHPEWKRDQLMALQNAWNGHTDAGWWIEHRNHVVAILLQEGKATFKQVQEKR